jgi:hypothetical protein
MLVAINQQTTNQPTTKHEPKTDPEEAPENLQTNLSARARRTTNCRVCKKKSRRSGDLLFVGGHETP